MNAQRFRIKQGNIRCTVLCLATINRLIVGDVRNDVQFRLHGCVDGLCLRINLCEETAGISGGERSFSAILSRFIYLLVVLEPCESSWRIATGRHA